MHKLEYVLENETHKILWEIWNINRSQNPVGWINKKKRKSCGFWHSSRPQGENKRNLKDRQIFGPFQRNKMRVTVIPIVNDALGPVTKGLEESLERLESRGWIEIVHSIVEIGQNIEKSPGDQWRLAVIQIRVKDNQVELVYNTYK